jgi:hypothetical protein
LFRGFLGGGSISHGGFVGGWGACRGYANCSVVYEYFVGRSKIVNVNIIVSPYVDEVILKLSKPRLSRRGRVSHTAFER